MERFTKLVRVAGLAAVTVVLMVAYATVEAVELKADGASDCSANPYCLEIPRGSCSDTPCWTFTHFCCMPPISNEP